MGYTALKQVSELNKIDFQIIDSVTIPKFSKVSRKYGKDVLEFIRNDCENLCFDSTSKKEN